MLTRNASFRAPARARGRDLSLVAQSMLMETPGKRLPKPAPRPEGPVVTDLTHLTPEVWLKVTAHLAPSDLARLSRQCKRLRSMMHKIGYGNFDIVFWRPFLPLFPGSIPPPTRAVRYTLLSSYAYRVPTDVWNPML